MRTSNQSLSPEPSEVQDSFSESTIVPLSNDLVRHQSIEGLPHAMHFDFFNECTCDVIEHKIETYDKTYAAKKTTASKNRE